MKISEINEVKRKMVNDIKEYNINISDKKYIKKAFELIKKNIIYKYHKNKVE